MEQSKLEGYVIKLVEVNNEMIAEKEEMIAVKY